jgi:hypothetical protein
MSNRILSDWLEGFLYYCDNTEPPELFKLWTGISTIAACLKRKCYLPWGMFTTYPNMYIVLVGPPALGKGVSMKPAMDMLSEVGVILSADAGSKEALTRAISKQAGSSEVLEDGKILLHSSLSIFSTEFCVFLGYKNLDLMGYLCEWFDCRDIFKFDAKDKTKADTVTNVWVNLLAGTTPQMIELYMSTETAGLGLASRIIFVYETSISKICPIPFLTEEQVQMKSHLVHDLQQIHLMKGAFSYTKKFMDRWFDWYTDNKTNPPFTDDKLNGYNGRRHIHILKLCQIICASESDDMVITERHFSRALEYLTLTEKKMTNVFAGMGKNELAPFIYRALSLLVQNGGEMNYQDLFRIMQNDVHRDNFDKLIRSLEGSGACTLIHKGGTVIIKKTSD